MIASSPSINYVVGAWGGPRRRLSASDDPTLYLREHARRLSTLSNSVSRVTIVDAYTPKAPAAYRDYLSDVSAHGIKRERDHSIIPVTLLSNAENFCGVYNSWVIGYEGTHSEYVRTSGGYYLFFEDDYVPVGDNFDRRLVDCMGEIGGCGYLCAIARAHGWGMHAGLASGVVRADAMARAYPFMKRFLRQCRTIEFVNNTKRSKVYEQIQWFQYAWSRSFNKAGVKIRDFGGRLEVRYARLNGKQVLFHATEGKGLHPLVMECL